MTPHSIWPFFSFRSRNVFLLDSYKSQSDDKEKKIMSHFRSHGFISPTALMHFNILLAELVINAVEWLSIAEHICVVLSVVIGVFYGFTCTLFFEIIDTYMDILHAFYVCPVCCCAFFASFFPLFTCSLFVSVLLLLLHCCWCVRSFPFVSMFVGWFATINSFFLCNFLTFFKVFLRIPFS